MRTEVVRQSLRILNFELVVMCADEDATWGQVAVFATSDQKMRIREEYITATKPVRHSSKQHFHREFLVPRICWAHCVAKCVPVPTVCAGQSSLGRDRFMTTPLSYELTLPAGCLWNEGCSCSRERSDIGILLVGKIGSDGIRVVRKVLRRKKSPFAGGHRSWRCLSRARSCSLIGFINNSK